MELSYKADDLNAAKQKIIYGKDWVYSNTKDESIPNLWGKNVITIFSEGFSQDIIDKFNRYSNLTPNISHLLDRSLWFDNYFNHTATTYRGIRGQMSSSYQYVGVDYYSTVEIDIVKKRMDNTVVNISSILQDNGYHTYFLCAHTKDDHMSKYLESFGFDRVYTADDFKDDGTELTDRELFEGLYKLLDSKDLKAPYFIGIYNLGTHYGQKSPDEVYNFQENELLNVMFNYDFQFGNFLRKFDNNGDLRKNTTLIITADHATFPGDEYVRAFKTEAYKVDKVLGKIPFIIYDEAISSQRIDVGGKNSLDFAPTLLHLLRINKADNYFLGCSLYDEKCAYPFEYVYALGNTFYYTNGRRLELFKEGHNIMERIKRFYDLSENKVK